MTHRVESGKTQFFKLNAGDKKRLASELIPVCWEEGLSQEFKVDLRIEVLNRRGVLAELAMAIAEVEANINDLTVNELDNTYTIIDLTLSIQDRQHLARAMRRIRRCQFVSRIIRSKDKDEEDPHEENHDTD